MIGILTEKPSAMRNFAKALGGTKGKYNGEDYVLVAARGHLYEFVMPDKQVSPALEEQYKTWSLDYLPWNEKDLMWKRQVSKSRNPKTGHTSDADNKALLKDIFSTLSKCSEIVIASDLDPTGEGSLLAWVILDELKLSPRKWSRMAFLDESEKSIREAFVKRYPLSGSSGDPDFLKGLYRSKWDFLSMQWTRVATKVGDGKSVLRQGRLKSAMVFLVGQALDALNNYKKIPFYENRFKDENGVVYSSKDEPTYEKIEDVPQIYKPSDVVHDGTERKKQAPPKLLDLAGLSAIMAGKGVKPKQVLNVYQKLYEAQIVSYPRTEDKTVTPEQFKELLPLVDRIAKVVGVDAKLLTHRKARATHVKSQGAHGANRPGPVVPGSLTSLKSYGSIAPDIYEILAKNYLAMLAPDYEYDLQRGSLKDYPKFKGTAHVPISLGYKAIFQDDDDTEVNAKGLGKKAKPFVHEGFPPKPPTPTMKWLMKQLERRDVGTGATRTSIFAEVTDERYQYPLLIEKRGRLSMTEFGEMSYQLLPGTHIGDLTITEKLMQDMRLVSEGKLKPEKGLAEIQKLISDDIKVMTKNAKLIKKGVKKMTDNKADQKIDYVKGLWNGKEIRFKRIQRGITLTDDEVEALLNGESIEKEFISAKGKPYKMAGGLANLTYKGYNYVGVDWDFVKREGPPEVWCQYKFSEKELNQLRDGEAIYIEGAVGKSGNAFSCTVRYGKTERGNMGIIPEFN